MILGVCLCFHQLLTETGLFENNTRELDIWLRHLDASYSKSDSLVLFLDEAFGAVASEPYSYTDTVLELMSEVIDKRASHKAHSLVFSGTGVEKCSARSR